MQFQVFVQNRNSINNNIVIMTVLAGMRPHGLRLIHKSLPYSVAYPLVVFANGNKDRRGRHQFGTTRQHANVSGKDIYQEIASVVQPLSKKEGAAKNEHPEPSTTGGVSERDAHTGAAAAAAVGKDESIRFGFSAGGLLFPFYIGVCNGLMKAGYMSERTRLAGASAGSLIAACVNSGLSMDVVLSKCQALMEDCRVHGTRGRLGIVLEKFLQDTLPEDAHLRCNDRTYVAVTQTIRFNSVQPVLVSQFEDKNDLIQALMTSCHIPFWLDGRLTNDFRGYPHVDGGLTNFIPLPPQIHPDEPGIRITCFASEQLRSFYSDLEIAPDTLDSWPYSITQMVQWAFNPADESVLSMLAQQGEESAMHWVDRYELLLNKC